MKIKGIGYWEGSTKPTFKGRPKKKDHRHNAAIIIQNSNACPFRYTRGQYKCAYCNLTFGDLLGVRLHWPDHSDRVEFLKYARAYRKIKVDVSDLRCELCMETMTNLDMLTEHLIAFHEKPIESEKGLGVIPYMIKDGRFICAYCGKSFVVFSALNTHVNTHNPNYICPTCGKVFATTQNLNSHVVVHDVNSDLKCRKCDEVFATKELKHLHNISKHAIAHPYKCPYCKEPFKNYNHRRMHLEKFHDRKVEYRCSLCPAVFSMSDRRRKHIRDVHMKRRTLRCSHCSQEFATPDNMTIQSQLHAGNNNNYCDVCREFYE